MLSYWKKLMLVLQMWPQAEAALWHRRLAHVSEKGLIELSKKGVFSSQDIKKLEFCENCVIWKSKKLIFQKGTHSTKEPLDYLHLDLWGPSRVETYGDGEYFRTFIDDFRRKVWVCILKHKHEAFAKSKNGILRWRIKRVRSSNISELIMGWRICQRNFRNSANQKA